MIVYFVRKTLFTLIFVCAFLVAVEVASAAPLTRDLTIGSVGEDVRDLQMFLNSNTSTAISGTGDGSTGKETTYFGQLTADAVMRFQNVYPEETYKKAGLSSANGFVGSLTRALINQKMGFGGSATVSVPTVTSVTPSVVEGSGYVYSTDYIAVQPQAPSATSPVSNASKSFISAFTVDLQAHLERNKDLFAKSSSTTTSATTTSTSDKPFISFLNVNVAKVGQTVTVFGGSLPSDLVVELNGYNVKTRVADDAKSATFTVPHRSDGEYEVTFLSNEKRKITYPKNMMLRLVDKDTEPPVILQYPTSITSGQIVTLTGNNFDTQSANTVLTALGPVSVTAKSTTELEFVMPNARRAPGASVATNSAVFEHGFLMVENNFGRSRPITEITYTLR